MPSRIKTLIFAGLFILIAAIIILQLLGYANNDEASAKTTAMLIGALTGLAGAVTNIEDTGGNNE